MSLYYDLETRFTSSLMTGRPLVIVEGRDDIKHYEAISCIANYELNIYAAENINMEEGCTSVIKIIEALQTKINERPENEYFILGIIDRDARFFRQEIPTNLKCLFVLKYYSLESHFISRNIIKSLVSSLTYIQDRLICEKSLDFIEKEFRAYFNKLYYFSLEALKNACEKDYITEFSYDNSADKIISDGNLYSRILLKKADLDRFANGINISLNFEDIKKISKGKWLLHIFCYTVLKYIKQLPGQCRDQKIKQCQYCASGNHLKCLYKMNTHYHLTNLKVYILTHPLIDDIAYIKDRFEVLINNIEQL